LTGKHLANTPNIIALANLRKMASAPLQIILPPSKLDEFQSNAWIEFLKVERQIWQNDFAILNKAFEFARDYLVCSLVSDSLLLEVPL